MSIEGTEVEDPGSSEKSFLRWGGLAGIAAGVFFVITIVTLIAFGPSTTATAAQLASRFPDVRTGLVVGNALYFLISVSLAGIALCAIFVSTNSAAYAPFALLAFFIFPVVFGVKLFRLSRAAITVQSVVPLPPILAPVISNAKKE